MDDQALSVKTGPRDVFLHLLAVVTLYASAAAFTSLIYQYINIYFPDRLETGYYFVQSAYQTVRWSIASLIVVFPTYFWTAWFLNKEYLRHPEKKRLRSRRWLLYFTLFAAALIIIGDLVTLIFHLLGGELTIRFLLKVLTIFFVAGSVFGYYFSELRGKGE